MTKLAPLVLLLLLCGACSSGSQCVDAEECRQGPGEPHYCEHYACNSGTCEYSWDGGIVTCGNTECAGPGDCSSSTPTMTISCVAGSCVGSP